MLLIIYSMWWIWRFYDCPVSIQNIYKWWKSLSICPAFWFALLLLPCDSWQQQFMQQGTFIVVPWRADRCPIKVFTFLHSVADEKMVHFTVGWQHINLSQFCLHFDRAVHWKQLFDRMVCIKEGDDETSWVICRNVMPQSMLES